MVFGSMNKVIYLPVAKLRQDEVNCCE
jgi:hypothetical protein